jgi:hypothetical protein
LDLRPKIAREAVMDICRDLQDRHGLLVPDEQLEQWTQMIVAHMMSHSIEFPKGEYVSTSDPGVVQQFRDKYPALERLISLAREEALRLWPEATFTFEVSSNPETSHICHEGQHLVMEINTHLPFCLEDGSPFMLAKDNWLDFTCKEGAYQQLVRELGDVSFLLLTDVTFEDEGSLLESDEVKP